MRESRAAVSHFGDGVPLTDEEVMRIAAWSDLDVSYEPEQESLAILWWPMQDFRLGRPVAHLVLSPRVRRGRNLLILHESRHVQRGDADEPTTMVHQCALPMCEPACDLYAAIALLPREVYELSDEEIETVLWDMAPLPDRGWELHRRKDIARRVRRMRELIDNYVD